MKKLVKVDENGQVHEIYSEYFVNLPMNHANKIPIDHPDKSITPVKLVDNLDLRNKTVLVDTPELT